MIYIENYDILITTSLSDIIFWSIDKGVILESLSFANK